MPTPAAPEEAASDRGALLPWPRTADDGTPFGIDLARYHRDVRCLPLVRWKGNARLFLDAEDLVQEVCRCILRCNRRPDAFDPRQGSLGHYVRQSAGNAIADMLKLEKRRAERELLAIDPERFDEVAAPEPDPDDGPFDMEAAPSDPGEREEFFRVLCVLHVTGELPVTEPLWKRAAATQD